jgi:hypothetical protein
MLALIVAIAGAPATRMGDPCITAPPASAEPRALIAWDIGQGVTLGPHSIAPYSISARLYPTLVIDRSVAFRLGGLVGVDLVNPQLEAAFGGRLTLRAFSLAPVGNIAVHLGAEGFYGTSGRGVGGPTALFDGGGLLSIALRGLHDFANHATILEAAVGIGRLGTLHAGEAGATPAPVPVGVLAEQRELMMRAVGAAIGAARDVSVERCHQLTATVRSFLGSPGAGATTMEAFRTALGDAQLAEVDRNLRPKIAAPPGITEAQIVAAWVQAMRDRITQSNS